MVDITTLISARNPSSGSLAVTDYSANAGIDRSHPSTANNPGRSILAGR